MRAKFAILIVLCTIFHNTQSLFDRDHVNTKNRANQQGRLQVRSVRSGFVDNIKYTHQDLSSVLNRILLPKIANFAAWYTEHKEEGKPDLDKLEISEEDKPMKLQTFEYSINSNVSLTIKDSDLINFGTNLRPVQVWFKWIGDGTNMLSIQYLAANVSYTGKFSTKGTLLNNTISFDGEGQFDMKTDMICTAYVILKIGGDIPVKVSNQGAAAQARCHVSRTGPPTFSGILKNPSPEIKESDRPGMERFLSSSLGTQVIVPLNRMMMTKGQMLVGIFGKQVEDALKDVTIFDVLNKWKPQPQYNTNLTPNNRIYGGQGGWAYAS